MWSANHDVYWPVLILVNIFLVIIYLVIDHVTFHSKNQSWGVVGMEMNQYEQVLARLGKKWLVPGWPIKKYEDKPIRASLGKSFPRRGFSSHLPTSPASRPSPRKYPLSQAPGHWERAPSTPMPWSCKAQSWCIQAMYKLQGTIKKKI